MLFGPIDHHAKFQMFKRVLVDTPHFGEEKKEEKKSFLGHFQKLVTGSEGICRSIMTFSFKKLS